MQTLDLALNQNVGGLLCFETSSSRERERGIVTLLSLLVAPYIGEEASFEFPAQDYTAELTTKQQFTRGLDGTAAQCPNACQKSFHLQCQRRSRHLALIHWGSTLAVAAFPRRQKMAEFGQALATSTITQVWQTPKFGQAHCHSLPCNGIGRD